MAHQRNVEGLRRSARRKHEETVRRTEDGMRRLVEQGRAVNFRTVADVAGVSTAWLYQQPQIKRQIQHLRAQDTSRGPFPAKEPKERRSDASKDAMIATLQQRVKRLESENGELRRQVEVAYGQLYEQQFKSPIVETQTSAAAIPSIDIKA